jgi:hypothetical protein
MDVVRRELTVELGRAAQALRRGNRSDRGIHDIRKRLRHCRALLRLLRQSLGKDAYQRENARLRDAARPLMLVRDAAVLVRALELKSLSPVMRKGGLGKIYKKSHRLADCLGADHDLALLHDKIIQHRPSGGAAAEALVHRLAQRRAKLQRKAYRRGRRLFSVSTRRLEARVRRRLPTQR